MGWYQFLAILKDDKAVAQAEAAKPPVACPIDGELLQEGKNGVLNCPMGNYRYP